MPRHGRRVPPADRRRRTSHVWVIIAAVVLLINGITVTTLLSGRYGGDGSAGLNGVFQDSRAVSAVEVAQAQALGVVSLDADAGNPELAVLADRTSAQFRNDFDVFAQDFLNDTRAEGLQVTSRVAAAGISDFDTDQATVVVATVGQAFDTREPQPRSRNFELRVQVAWIDQAWRVDGLEFV